MERKTTKELIKYYLKELKKWSEAELDKEIQLVNQGYIKDDDNYNEKDNAYLVNDIITHYSIQGRNIITDILVSMVSKEVDIDSGSTIIADAIDDYINGELRIDSMCLLLEEFAIMGNNCIQEEVDNWDKLYAELKKKDKSYVELEG